MASALALSNPLRRIGVIGFSILGAGNACLIIYTYENTPGVLHFADLPGFFLSVAKNHIVQLVAILILGIIFGVFGPREYRKRTRTWYRGYDAIFRLGDRAVLTACNDEFNQLRNQRTRLFNSGLEHIYDGLRNGTILARGFHHPLGLHPKEIVIPAAQWKFLRLNGDFSEATGQGITYTALDFARGRWI